MRVLGVCGGNGVFLHPFKKYLIANVEPRSIFYTKDDKQWKSNFGNIPMVKELPNTNGVGDIDLIIGAPDCGHSSILALSRAKKKGNPRENGSIDTYFKSIKRFKPDMWVMENLPALLDVITEDEITELFPNYRIRFFCDSVSIYGNSQITRKRLVIIATKNTGRFKTLKVIKPKTPLKLLKTGELLKGLENTTGNFTEFPGELITLYAGFKMKVEDIAMEWILKREGKSRWEVTGRNFTTAPGVYRNLADSYPATARKSNRQFTPDGRMMTARELARIQGVPDDFIIYNSGPKSADFKYWINKGRASVTKCPPYEIGKYIYNLIFNNGSSRKINKRGFAKTNQFRKSF